ncbi:transglutaminase-like cysteine peptidase [Acidovorax sp. sic0104]|uniref:transglutaminase-like cysteine peptidase n=1 Tax=Acidovorax sp. sic0104 TaxID=2854784 RepID=UPI0021083041|nr:transglutaminase-like cysteine peptidase [Acidovorax sp. sic0104]
MPSLPLIRLQVPCRATARWCAVLALAACALLMSAAFSAPDFDKTQALALKRYGAQGAALVTAWRKLLQDAESLSEPEKLVQVNNFFNRRMLFENDTVVWQQNDYWATPLEFMGKGAGDCEDFSIAKYVTLLHMGVPNAKLRMIYVRARLGGPGSDKSEAHMVLGYYATPSGEPMVLDNLITTIRPASARSDLSPVFSFNSEGLWVAGANAPSADPTARLSRWRDVLERMQQEGF